MNIDKRRWLTNPAEIIQPGDLFRILDDDGVFSEWQSADHYAGSRVGSFAQWYGMGIQFARVPTAFAAEQPRNLADTIKSWQPESIPEQSPTPTPDSGSKYHRTITQTLPGDTHGCSVTVDVYDVLRAFRVACPATQHAIKKLLCPGQRGNKSAEQDLRETIGSIERSIQLLGDG